MQAVANGDYGSIVMPEKLSNPSADEYGQLELLLKKQREALLVDDFDAVEARSLEIADMVARLHAQDRLPTGACLEQLRSSNEQLMQLLIAKKESAAAELATMRRKRDLNKSYRTYDE
jgi:hypothetical protein